jgi:AraC-like DNA-binding protein
MGNRATAGGRREHRSAGGSDAAADLSGRDTITIAQATDPDEAEDLLAGVYLPNRLQLVPGDAGINMELASVRFGTLTVGRLGYGRTLRLTTAEARQFHFNIPLAGRAISVSGPRKPLATGPGQGTAFPPGSPAEIEWSNDCVQMCLMVPRATLESELEQLLGGSVTRPLVFGTAMDLDTTVGRSWDDWLHLVDRELDRPTGLAAHPLTGRHMERLLLDGLLLGQPHNYQEQLTAPARSARPGPIARAVRTLQDRAAEPWSTTTLALEVHLSVRAVQEGFQRHVGTPPMTYLRAVRLRRVHEELRRADPGSTTVAAVAMQWGFVHMSRFAIAYRQAFGEAPSQTLSR